MSTYTAWQSVPTVSKDLTSGVVPCLRNFENSSWTVLKTYGLRNVSKALQTNRKGKVAFLVPRHICTLKRRIDSKSSRGRESMAGEGLVLQLKSSERGKWGRGGQRGSGKSKEG